MFRFLKKRKKITKLKRLNQKLIDYFNFQIVNLERTDQTYHMKIGK